VSAEDVEPSPELRTVLDAHLGDHRRGGGSRTALVPVHRLLVALGLRRGGGQSADEDLAALLRLIGVDPGDPDRIERQLADALEQSRALGVPQDALPAVIQAYARAIGRIAAAEAEIASMLMQDVPEAQRAAVLDEALAALIPVTERGFSAIHQAMLHDALLDALTAESLEEVQSAPTAIALVDISASTVHLANASHVDVEQMVDALFEAGQRATARRAAQAVKYVGDGVFLAGREPRAVAAAALDAVGRIEKLLPLRARAGLAHGPVVRRAGDIFGLPVNVAQLLTKAAAPGTLLADEAATTLLPVRMRGRTRPLDLHPALGRVDATVITRR
jgi:class 3 adenylate cyclase